MEAKSLSLFGLVSFGLFIVFYSLKKRVVKASLPKQLNDSKTLQDDEYIFPPLPNEVVSLLNLSKLCFLATASDLEPHLSLMNFTYFQRDEVLIFCTRRNTKKYEQLISSPNVSILIHDFPHLDNDEVSNKFGRKLSITLNGIASFLDDNNELSKFYRSLHLGRNPEYSQFISQSNSENSPTVFIVKIDRARMCDIMDQVKHWNADKIPNTARSL